MWSLSSRAKILAGAYPEASVWTLEGYGHVEAYEHPGVRAAVAGVSRRIPVMDVAGSIGERSQDTDHLGLNEVDAPSRPCPRRCAGQPRDHVVGMLCGDPPEAGEDVDPRLVARQFREEHLDEPVM